MSYTDKISKPMKKQEGISLAAEMPKVVSDSNYELGAALFRKLNDFISSKIDKISSAAATKATEEADAKWEKALITCMKDMAREELERLENVRLTHTSQIAASEGLANEFVSIIQGCAEALGKEKVLREAAFAKIEQYRDELELMKQDRTEVVDAYEDEKALHDTILVELRASEQNRIEIESSESSEVAKLLGNVKVSMDADSTNLAQIAQDVKNLTKITTTNLGKLTQDVRTSLDTLDQSVQALGTSTSLNFSKLRHLVEEVKTASALSDNPQRQHANKIWNDPDTFRLARPVATAKSFEDIELVTQNSPTPARVEIAKKAKIRVLEKGSWTELTPDEPDQSTLRAGVNIATPENAEASSSRYRASDKAPIFTTFKASPPAVATQYGVSFDRRSNVQVLASPQLSDNSFLLAPILSPIDNGSSDAYSRAYARREPRSHPAPIHYPMFSESDVDEQELVVVPPKHTSKVRKSRGDHDDEPKKKKPKYTHPHGKWVQIHIGYGTNKNLKNAHKHASLRAAPISDELKERISLADFQNPGHRDRNRAANRAGQRVCWIAAHAGRVSLGLSSTETSPCGVCLQKFKREGSCECFYFGRKLDDIWMFKVGV